METAGYRLCSRQQAACPLKFNPQAPEPRTTRPQPQRVCRPQRPMLKPFTSSTPSEELQMLFFSETLAMVSNTGEPQGELTIDVQRGTHKNISGTMLHCPLVHAFSRGFMDKMLCGNSLLGYLSWNLEIKEQQSHEFIKFHILPMERKMSLLKQEDQLAMTRSIKEGEEVKTEVTFFPWHSTAGFISESANLLLLRVMAWRRMVPSNARFLALDMEGKLCSSTYQALGSQTIQVDHQQVEVFIVEQTVHSDEGIPTSCQFYLLPDGHLAKRVQVGSPGCCMITKMPVIRERDEIEPRPVFEKKPLMWEEDMELYSRFLDRKEELRLSHTRYLQQHPEATALISDFLLFLLLRQPADVVTFAAEHFGPFATCWSPTPGLRSSNRPSPFRALDPESF
ncbi:PREDICTED: ciliogenesis-associated TTC17-interacting protein isoform X3 [Hipposideros armiger]|uniref:Ciliogenesis-associated TTC17-interacting protein n=1 Tax=Hipposideros armiger TaxID=186990 RepID=A0A8B7R0W3_HIPAR|nr:PREDICTED: ciliogenesis-associated TTC17-interacting protein isoform X3 [Hipposideros armiger]